MKWRGLQGFLRKPKQTSPENIIDESEKVEPRTDNQIHHIPKVVVESGNCNAAAVDSANPMPNQVTQGLMRWRKVKHEMRGGSGWKRLLRAVIQTKHNSVLPKREENNNNNNRFLERQIRFEAEKLQPGLPKRYPAAKPLPDGDDSFWRKSRIYQANRQTLRQPLVTSSPGKKVGDPLRIYRVSQEFLNQKRERIQQWRRRQHEKESALMVKGKTVQDPLAVWSRNLQVLERRRQASKPQDQSQLVHNAVHDPIDYWHKSQEWDRKRRLRQVYAHIDVDVANAIECTFGRKQRRPFSVWKINTELSYRNRIYKTLSDEIAQISTIP